MGRPKLESPSRSTIHKRAQKAVSVVGMRCARCGSRENLDRHHEDYTKATEVIILCHGCHCKLHWDSADPPLGRKKQRECVICGRLFWPRHSKNNRTCGKEDCQRAAKRNNAFVRWHGKDIASSGVPVTDV